MRGLGAIFVLGIVANGAIFAQEPLEVSGKAVIFFAPSSQTLQGFSAQKRRNIEEATTDLQFYRDQVQGFLLTHTIQNIWTTRPIAALRHTEKTFPLEWDNFAESVGVILTDGQQPPQVSVGVLTYIELVLLMRRYFRLGTVP